MIYILDKDIYCFYFEMGSTISRNQQSEISSNSNIMETNMIGFQEILKSATQECANFIEVAPNLKYDTTLDHGLRSNIFKAMDNDKNYYIKMFEMSLFQKSYEIESAIYTSVTNALIDNLNTLFLVKNIGYIKCDGLLDRLKLYKQILEREGNDLAITLNNVVNKFNSTADKIGIIINESYDITLDKYLGTNYLLPMDYADIIFQVVWTLACFSEILLRHNDLDPKHIFIVPVENVSLDNDVESERPTYVYELPYKNGNLYFVQRPRYEIKIFHYEKSNIMNYLPNPNLNENCSIGEGCNVHNNGFDLYTFICKLRSKIPEFRYGADHDYKSRAVLTPSTEDSYILSDIYDFFESIINRQRSIEANNKCFPKGINQYTREQLIDLGYTSADKEVILPLNYKNLILNTPLFQRFLQKSIKSSQGVIGTIMRLPNNDQRMKIKKTIIDKFPDLVVVSKELPDPDPQDFSTKKQIESTSTKRGKQEVNKNEEKPGFFYSERHKMWLPSDMCEMPKRK